ncbi:MAG: hypothetical protein ACI9DO_001130 [Reinekea sp.]|jgi:hypothetical protein
MNGLNFHRNPKASIVAWALGNGGCGWLSRLRKLRSLLQAKLLVLGLTCSWQLEAHGAHRATFYFPSKGNILYFPQIASILKKRQF